MRFSSSSPKRLDPTTEERKEREREREREREEALFWLSSNFLSQKTRFFAPAFVINARASFLFSPIPSDAGKEASSACHLPSLANILATAAAQGTKLPQFTRATTL